jgi:ankyrin repeat protein
LKEDHIITILDPANLARYILNFFDRRLDIMAQDSDGETALHRAASGGHIDVIETLLQVGANV